MPIRGHMKLRSLLRIIGFIAAGVREAPEYDVAKDPRTGGDPRNSGGG